ncbi:hypothetical protein OIDMADRAFT_35889 [Oidiodendron maius Zn]|uniref:Uncharacterized protein n=1 Tax=Oidiodendron maius (strain Zn) TaxID=913774 RepID=A0A0C3GPS4_OIDMZ|nr:hypothetical protein OIDMADRAFT_35889 [Oidiodendron maius Zn]
MYSYERNRCPVRQTLNILSARLANGALSSTPVTSTHLITNDFWLDLDAEDTSEAAPMDDVYGRDCISGVKKLIYCSYVLRPYDLTLAKSISHQELFHVPEYALDTVH